jgi:dienelactone hydrolase
MQPNRIRLSFAAMMLSCACTAHNGVPVARSPLQGRAAAPSRNVQVVELLVQRSFAQLAATFDESLRAKVPPQDLEAVWSSVTQRAGAYRGIQETRSFSGDTGEVDVSLLRFEHGVEELKVRWTKDARIAGILLHPGAVQARALAIARAVLSRDASDVYGHFSSAMKAALSSAKFEETLAAVHAQTGANPAIQDIDVEAGKFDVATVQCRTKSGGFDLRLTFRKGTDQLEGLYFLPPNAATRPDEAPPSYADPSRYEERPVEVGDKGRGLPATLTLPVARDRPVPAVVLVHGSGPQDRDETTLANKPFRDFALGLASRGIAVLRYEKRTFGKNVATLRDPASITFDEETVDDAVAAVRLLLGTPGVDPTRVVVVGHSQGGMAAPRIAEREPRVRALVLLAPPARPLEDLLLEQNRYLVSLDTSNQDATRAALAALEAQIARIKSSGLASAKPEELPMGIPASWWLSMRDYAPTEVAKQVQKPTLLLQGDRDFQVTAADLALWKAALGAAWATVRVLPGLNHLFEAGEGAPSPAEYARPSHVSEVAVAQVAEWILALPPSAAAKP